jgi:DNA-binding NarL/FixJ family response regulator
MNRIRFAVADDHAMVREGFKTLLASQPDFEEVGEAFDGPSAVRNAVAQRPDVLVLDFGLPGLNGAEAAERLREEAPEVKVLIVSAHEDRAYLKQALQAGAKGFVLKRAAAQELIQAVRVVADGGVYLDPALAGHLVDEYVGVANGSAKATLSERETEVLQMLAQGYANKEIAAKLEISVKTVETYKTRAMEKLGLADRVDLVRYAVKQGWLADE